MEIIHEACFVARTQTWLQNHQYVNLGHFCHTIYFNACKKICVKMRPSELKRSKQFNVFCCSARSETDMAGKSSVSQSWTFSPYIHGTSMHAKNTRENATLWELKRNKQFYVTSALQSFVVRPSHKRFWLDRQSSGAYVKRRHWELFYFKLAALNLRALFFSYVILLCNVTCFCLRVFS